MSCQELHHLIGGRHHVMPGTTSSCHPGRFGWSLPILQRWAKRGIQLIDVAHLGCLLRWQPSVAHPLNLYTRYLLSGAYASVIPQIAAGYRGASRWCGSGSAFWFCRRCCGADAGAGPGAGSGSALPFAGAAAALMLVLDWRFVLPALVPCWGRRWLWIDVSFCRCCCRAAGPGMISGLARMTSRRARSVTSCRVQNG